MKRILLTTAFSLVAGLAQAGITSTQVVDLFTSQGYTNIEVTTGLTQMKVEAVMGSVKLEVIYDLNTGAILQQENSVVRGSTPSGGATEVKTSSEDFTAIVDATDAQSTDAADGTDNQGTDEVGGGNNDNNDQVGGATDDTNDQGGDQVGVNCAGFAGRSNS